MIATKVQQKLEADHIRSFVGELPSTTEDVIAIKEYSNYDNVEYFGKSNSLEQPVVKVVVRNASYEAGQQLIEAVCNSLHKYRGPGILSSMLIGSAIYLGRGELKLHEFQATFKIHVEE